VELRASSLCAELSRPNQKGPTKLDDCSLMSAAPQRARLLPS